MTDESKRMSFSQMCAALPADFSWGDSLTPDVFQHIEDAILQAATRDADAVAQIPHREFMLTRGAIALVDAEDYDRIAQYSWWASRDGYAERKILAEGKVTRRCISMHRFVMNIGYGDRMEVDHINGNRLDNRKANLRLCTHEENLRNKHNRKDNSSGYKGVYPSKKEGRWLARIVRSGKTHYLGKFDSPESAYQAYCEAADRLHGEFANYGQIGHGAGKETKGDGND